MMKSFQHRQLDFQIGKLRTQATKLDHDCNLLRLAVLAAKTADDRQRATELTLQFRAMECEFNRLDRAILTLMNQRYYPRGVTA